VRGLAIATDLSSALFVLMLRVHFEQAEPSSGLLKLLRSPVCAKAVNAIVNAPAHDWTLDALAHRAHVSRQRWSVPFRRRLAWRRSPSLRRSG